MKSNVKGRDGPDIHKKDGDDKNIRAKGYSDKGRSEDRRRGFMLLYIVPAVMLMLIVFCIIRFAVPYLQRTYKVVSIHEMAAIEGEKMEDRFGRVLTIYFTRVGNTDFEEDVDAVASASLMEDSGRLIGNSELLAKMVQNSVGGDIYAITTQKRYPSSYKVMMDEVIIENREKEPLDLIGELPDINQYDEVFMVYPVWWGSVPKALASFAAQADFDGRTVYAIVTHGGSGIADSVRDFEKTSGAVVDGNVLEVYDQDVATAREKVTDWLKGLNR